MPLISVETLQRLRDAKPQGGIGLLTVKLDDPTGYGRITRENGKVTGIVEHKDATDEQRQIQEINTGILIANGADMKRWLAKLTNNNAQGEYYITDIIALAYQEGREIVAVHPQRLSEDVSPVKTAKLPALLSTKTPPTSSVRFRRSTPAF